MIAWPALQRPNVDAYGTTREDGVATGGYASLNLGLHVGDREDDVLVNRERVTPALRGRPRCLRVLQAGALAERRHVHRGAPGARGPRPGERDSCDGPPGHDGAGVVELAGAAFGDRPHQVVRPDGTGKWTFDLWWANTIQLTDECVPAEQVHLAGLATGAGSSFFSHRFKGPCGRFGPVTRLTGRSQ